ncbi:NAD(P)-binding protein [Mycena venus]|uniref:NAD(P)-binding protein n=1 Tax=Mycena venus TaxID=2733690 RepID=A0A8H6XJ81_9AGAR|nr:NAD(P)-binding protein [Mycena venus]
MEQQEVTELGYGAVKKTEDSIEVKIQRNSKNQLYPPSRCLGFSGRYPLVSSHIMPSLTTVRASNASYKPTYLPVAIFLGGTSGIGRGTAEAFARHTNGLAHIILLGRNAAAAQSILASFPQAHPWLNVPAVETRVTAFPPPVDRARQGSVYRGWERSEFVECDASLVRNAHATATTLAARPDLPRVHFLILTAGYVSLGGREDTEEGLDRKLVLKYYSRWAFMGTVSENVHVAVQKFF